MKVIDEPQNARSRRTAAALLQAARDLLEQDGFAALTMTTVAEHAGVSRRAVYLHFATRTDLLAALYRSLGGTEDLARSLQAVWDCPDAVTALSQWAHHIARSHPRILAVLRAVERARHGDPDAAQLWQNSQNNWLKGSRRLMRWLADEGRLAPHWTVDTAADLMWGLMSIDLLDRLLNQRHWSRTRIAQHLAALFQATFVGVDGSQCTF
jgi:AcrR family transcriptional regulator